jgi:lipopolysaccharide/colanic/teichoic acid biosynthesis glycosyltransferase
MQVNAESKGQLTVGGRDSRITNVGYFLRKFKLDELPQLFNVLNGTMSFCQDPK